MQLFSWMCSIPLAMAALSVEVKAASMVYGTTPLGQWYLIFNHKTRKNENAIVI